MRRLFHLAAPLLFLGALRRESCSLKCFEAESRQS